MTSPRSLQTRSAGNWTEESANAFAHKIAFDYIAQIEKTLEERGLTRAQLAEQLGVTQGAVSHVLNNPQNLTLKTIGKYCRVLGLKASVVAYEDGDPSNRNGLIGSTVFHECWHRLGSPRDIWAIRSLDLVHAGTTVNLTAHFFFTPRRVTVSTYCAFITNYDSGSVTGHEPYYFESANWRQRDVVVCK